jgi:hypothetical protein
MLPWFIITRAKAKIQPVETRLKYFLFPCHDKPSTGQDLKIWPTGPAKV